MKKQKLKLNELNIKSFITDSIAKEQVLGGNVQPLTYNCSVHSCTGVSIPADQCATTDNACPTVHIACPSNPATACVEHTIKNPCRIETPRTFICAQPD